MIYVFEGHDGAGKTTLANIVSRELNIPIFKDKEVNKTLMNLKAGYAISQVGLFLVKFIRDLCPDVDVIFDRYWVSEIVYSKVLNRPTNEDANKAIEEIMHELGAVTILCFKPEDDVLKFKDDFVTPSQNMAARDAYFDWAATTICRVLYFKTGINTPEEDGRYLIQYCKGEKDRHENNRILQDR